MSGPGGYQQNPNVSQGQHQMMYQGGAQNAQQMQQMRQAQMQQMGMQMPQQHMYGGQMMQPHYQQHMQMLQQQPGPMGQPHMTTIAGPQHMQMGQPAMMQSGTGQQHMGMGIHHAQQGSQLQQQLGHVPQQQQGQQAGQQQMQQQPTSQMQQPGMVPQSMPQQMQQTPTSMMQQQQQQQSQQLGMPQIQQPVSSMHQQQPGLQPQLSGPTSTVSSTSQYGQQQPAQSHYQQSMSLHPQGGHMSTSMSSGSISAVHGQGGPGPMMQGSGMQHSAGGPTGTPQNLLQAQLQVHNTPRSPAISVPSVGAQQQQMTPMSQQQATPLSQQQATPQPMLTPGGPPSAGPGGPQSVGGPHSVNPPTPSLGPHSAAPGSVLMPPSTPATSSSAHPSSEPPPHQPLIEDPILLTKTLVCKDLRHSFLALNRSAAESLKTGQVVENYNQMLNNFLAVCDVVEYNTALIMETAKQLNKMEKVLDDNVLKQKGDTPTLMAQVQGFVGHSQTLKHSFDSTIMNVTKTIERLRKRQALPPDEEGLEDLEADFNDLKQEVKIEED